MINPLYRFLLGLEQRIADASSTIQENKVWDVERATLLNRDGIDTSGYIPVEPGVITVWGGVYSAAFHDSERNLLQVVSPDENGNITAPIGADTVQVSAYHTSIETAALMTWKRQASPVWKDDLAKEWAQESNTRFLRASLSGDLTFIGKDYVWLSQRDNEDLMLLRIDKSNDNGGTWATYFTGTFAKSDCEWNDWDKTCAVTPTVRDAYTDVLAGIENEYDFIKLGTAADTVTYQKEAAVQIYFRNTESITTLRGGVWSDGDTTTTVDDHKELTDKYHFAWLGNWMEAEFTDNYDNRKLYFAARMTAAPADAPAPRTPQALFEGAQDRSRFYWEKKTEEVQNGIDRVWLEARVEIKAFGLTFKGSDTKEVAPSYEGSWEPDDDAFPVGEMELTAENPGGETRTGKIVYWQTKIYGRILADVERDSKGDALSELPSDDMAADQHNMRYVRPYKIQSNIKESTETSQKPTEWAVGDTYFVEPPEHEYYPIGRGIWNHTSFWLHSDAVEALQSMGIDRLAELRHAYRIHNVIATLLEQFAPNLKHEGNKEYSSFLYGTGGTNLAGGLAITPVSNITVSNYTQEAQKGELSLKDITDMLRDVYKCYWFVDGNKFRIERVDYFNTGKHGNISADLTRMRNARNGKKWGWGQKSWNYDKSEMPERYELEWGSDVSEPFTVDGVDIISRFAEKGRKESVSIGMFTPDISRMLLYPDDYDKDGFVLLKAGGSSNLYPFYAGTDGYTINTQTGKVEEDKTRLNLKVKGLVDSNNMPAKGMAVTPGETYKVNYAEIIAFYRADNSYMVGQYSDLSSTTAESFTVPTDAAYMVAVIQAKYDALFRVYQPVDTVAYWYDERRRVRLQNGELSWRFIVPTYWLVEMPGKKIKIGDDVYYADAVTMSKTGTVTFPAIDDPDTGGIIRTYVGDGVISKLSINLSSRMVKATLKYDTEQ